MAMVQNCFLEYHKAIDRKCDILAVIVFVLFSSYEQNVSACASVILNFLSILLLVFIFYMHRINFRGNFHLAQI